MVCLFLTGLVLYFLILALGVLGTIGFYILVIVLAFKAIDYIFNKLCGR